MISIGSRAEASLPTMFSALALGAAELPLDSVSSCISVLTLNTQPPDEVLSPLLQDYNECHALFHNGASLFPYSFQLSSCVFALPSAAELSAREEDRRLLSTLRGTGMPLSYLTDWEAAEWGFRSVLLHKNLPQLEAMTAEALALPEDAPAVIVLLFDPSDPVSAGIALPLLSFLRGRTEAAGHLQLGLLCVPEILSGESSGGPVLRRVSETLQARGLLRAADNRETAGADFAWIAALPASLARSRESFRLLYTASARVLGRLAARRKFPSAGLHTLDLPSSLTFGALGDRAASAAAMLLSSAWALGDLFPSLRAESEKATLLRALAPTARAAFFRKCCKAEDSPDLLSARISLLERTLKALLTETLALIRSLPDALRLTERNSLLWRQAVSACGQSVTLAAEYDVSRREAADSGMDQVKPVHRVSLEDTDEEKLIRRLSEQKDALDASLSRRSAALAELGGFRACQALQDCLDKCLAALDTARVRFREAAAAAESSALDLGMRERRIRLLEAAVDRCRQDLSAARVPPAVSALPAHPQTEPLASELLTVSAANAVSALLQAEPQQEAAARKSLTEIVPAFLTEMQLPDTKALFRELSLSCHFSSEQDAVAGLLAGAFSVCLKNVAGHRFLPPDELPSIPLLPDVFPQEPLLSFGALSLCLPAPQESSGDEADLRGLLAMMILSVFRRRASDEAELRVTTLRPAPDHASPVLEAWLSGKGARQALLLTLEQPGGASHPAAVIIPEKLLMPARRTAAFRAVLPAFASWIDPEGNRFRDPCSSLSPEDRQLLKTQLQRLLNTPGAAFLSGFLRPFVQDLEAAGAPGDDPLLALRLKAACALSALPAFQSSVTCSRPAYEHFLSSDPVCAALAGTASFPVPDSLPDHPSAVYSWKGIPFARESSASLLESLSVPEEEHVLTTLNQECLMLSGCSDDYREALCRNLQALLSRFPDASESARSVAWKMLADAEKPISEKETLLVWPWDPESPSIRTILEECLGSGLAAAAASPFTEKLTVFPARNQEIIGDALLRSQCVLPPFIRSDTEAEAAVPASDTVLPPLSPDFAAALCASPEGRTLVTSRLLSFSRNENGSVQADLTLEGGFTLRMRRTYSAGDLLSLFSQDIPTLAVWPAVPYPEDQWHAYYVYTRLSPGFSLRARSGGADSAWAETPEDLRSVMTLSGFPSCFVLQKGDAPVGSLLNLLPSPSVPDAGEITGCVDIGSSAAAVMLEHGGIREPLHGPGAVRTLLSNPASSPDLLRREFLPAVPVSALLPAAVRIFQNAPGQEPVPFRDGILLMASSVSDIFALMDEPLYTSLKWEGEKGRAVRLCLHQIMLLTAFQARSAGASALAWRFALPDDMAPEGREAWVRLIQTLVPQVARESGLSLPGHLPPVAFSTESAALGAYFRLVAPEDTRGGFMTLDLGSSTADLSLFLRGRDHAERTCQLPLGIQYMLLPSLIRDPEMLLRDFSFTGQADFLSEVSTLSGILRESARDPARLRHARLALDTLAADRLPLLLAAAAQARSEGRPTRTGALILLHLSYLMMLSGLMLLQISADSNRNDFLPEQMTLFLAGRGAAVPEAFSGEVRLSLWRFLTMFRNRRVASLSMLFSSEKKMEIAVGLSAADAYAGMPPAAPVPVSVAIRPEDLLPEFLLRFLREFPGECTLLFPGLFTGQPGQPFTPFGQSVLSASIDSAFANQEQVLRPYDALASWPALLLDLLHDHLPPEGGVAPWNS